MFPHQFLRWFLARILVVSLRRLQRWLLVRSRQVLHPWFHRAFLQDDLRVSLRVFRLCFLRASRLCHRRRVLVRFQALYRARSLLFVHRRFQVRYRACLRQRILRLFLV